jgi:hypothetical protein
MTKQEFRDLLLGRRIVEVEIICDVTPQDDPDGSSYLENVIIVLDDGTRIMAISLHGNESALCVEPPGGSR